MTDTARILRNLKSARGTRLRKQYWSRLSLLCCVDCLLQNQISQPSHLQNECIHGVLTISSFSGCLLHTCCNTDSRHER
jgi:hypothetical protein